jgi:cell wall-associated NlpC family hydrolase
MDLQHLNGVVARVVEDHGLDRRFCHAVAVPLPPDGRLVVECTDGPALDAIRERAGADAASVDFRLLDGSAPGLPAGLVIASSVADIRREGAHTAELVTQAIYGESVQPLKLDGDWYLVRLYDGYVGWLRSWHAVERSPAAQAAYMESAGHRVASNLAEVVEAPEPDALPVTDLVIGTRLHAQPCGRRGWRAVNLPDGREGYIAARSIERQPSRRRPSRESLAATGLRFLGIPYIWGGNTPKGFDCSGLIQRVFWLHGIELPRDSDLQARVGRLIPAGRPEALHTGDLLFFGRTAESVTHVAMALSDGLFLHAYGQVRVGSLDPAHRLYESGLHRIWLHNRDPFRA